MEVLYYKQQTIVIYNINIDCYITMDITYSS